MFDTVDVESTIGTNEEQKADAFKATRTAEHTATLSRFSGRSPRGTVTAVAVLRRANFRNFPDQCIVSRVVDFGNASEQHR